MLDHLGPMTATVADNALLLDVLAGPDGLDPRQRPMPTGGYVDALEMPGAGPARRDPEGRIRPRALGGRRRRDRAPRGRGLGARTASTWSRCRCRSTAYGMSAWIPIRGRRRDQRAPRPDGCTMGAVGFQPTSLMDRHRAGLGNGNEFPDILKMAVLMARFLIEDYGMHYYARAHNVVRQLRGAYDHALAGVDLLVMPTSPTKAHALPDPNGTRADLLAPGFSPDHQRGAVQPHRSSRDVGAGRSLRRPADRHDDRRARTRASGRSTGWRTRSSNPGTGARRDGDAPTPDRSSGIRVLEFDGPLTAHAGRLLWELGADVVLVEPAERLADARARARCGVRAPPRGQGGDRRGSHVRTGTRARRRAAGGRRRA